jgi:hypothetical protein
MCHYCDIETPFGTNFAILFILTKQVVPYVVISVINILNINIKLISMKKHILGFALVATIIGSISMGCGSEKAAGGSGSDSTKTDTTAVTAPATTPTTPTDTAKKDTTTRDTSKKVPQ